MPARKNPHITEFLAIQGEVSSVNELSNELRAVSKVVALQIRKRKFGGDEPAIFVRKSRRIAPMLSNIAIFNMTVDENDAACRL
jgi:hypothetical protein